MNPLFPLSRHFSGIYPGFSWPSSAWRFLLALVFSWLGALSSLEGATSSLEPGDLRCEYLVNPVGIDNPAPHLSWVLNSPARDQEQTAYQVLAASSLDVLNQNRGNIWDSGRVNSAEQSQIAFTGQSLRSSQQVYWKVRVWDKDRKPSAWSKPAHWTVGLLQPEDWQAQWIGNMGDSSASPDLLQGAKWIWSVDAQSSLSAPVGTRYFRREWVLPTDVSIRRALCWMAGDNEFELYVNGHRIGQGSFDEPAEFDFSHHLRPGTNTLAVKVVNGASQPNPAGLLGAVQVELANGEKMTLNTDAHWHAATQAADQWMQAGFSEGPWVAAKELGANGIAPWGRKQVNAASRRPAPILRKTFQVTGTPRRALLYVCGLGFHEVRLNGKKVGEAVLEPGWTNYRKRALYTAYDVTSCLRSGRNALAILLGNGMYNVAGGRYVKFKGSFGDPKLLLHLRIESGEGRSTLVVSDPSWRTAPSAITFNCIYGGEDYDARAEMPGWDQPETDDSSWASVQVVSGPGAKLSSQSSLPSKIMEELAPVRVTQPQPGVFVYDLGKNFSGWPEVTAQGPGGATIKMIPGELLDEQGRVTQRSSGGPVSFSYTLKGEGLETWHPRFTYYGFRYVQVEGAVPQDDLTPAGGPQIVSLKGHFIHAAGPPVGQFSCSNPLLNRIHELITAAIRCNLQSVLTDCPHREKLGWLEVSHLLARSLLYNFDGARFYTKICHDMAEAQRPNGLVPDIAPEYTVFSGGFVDSPEWGSAFVINPWHIYELYGDARPLALHYEAMKGYVEYLGHQAKDHIISHGLGDWYDIGPNPPGESQLTSKGVTATAIYYHDLRLLERAARMLGKTADQARFHRLAVAVGHAFNQTFFRPEQGCYDRNSQTANAMPLVLGLVDPAKQQAVLQHLVEQIRADANRVTAGDVGFGYLVRALCDGMRGDVLFDLVCQTNGPGYAEQLRRGATTLTEAWDANPASSQNHCMLGHAEEWLYRGIAGIVPDPEQPAYKHFQIKPQIVGGLTWAKASHDSLRGRIVSEWKTEGNRLMLRVVVPPNSSATVYLPARELKQVKESNRSVRQGREVRSIRMEGGNAVIEIGSGNYEFSSESFR